MPPFQSRPGAPLTVPTEAVTPQQISTKSESVRAEKSFETYDTAAEGAYSNVERRNDSFRRQLEATQARLAEAQSLVKTPAQQQQLAELTQKVVSSGTSVETARSRFLEKYNSFKSSIKESWQNGKSVVSEGVSVIKESLGSAVSSTREHAGQAMRTLGEKVMGDPSDWDQLASIRRGWSDSPSLQIPDEVEAPAPESIPGPEIGERTLVKAQEGGELIAPEDAREAIAAEGNPARNLSLTESLSERFGPPQNWVNKIGELLTEKAQGTLSTEGAQQGIELSFLNNVTSGLEVLKGFGQKLMEEMMERIFEKFNAQDKINESIEDFTNPENYNKYSDVSEVAREKIQIFIAELGIAAPMDACIEAVLRHKMFQDSKAEHGEQFKGLTEERDGKFGNKRLSSERGGVLFNYAISIANQM